MYQRCQRWMLIINNRFLSLYDYNFLLVIERRIWWNLGHKRMTKEWALCQISSYPSFAFSFPARFCFGKLKTRNRMGWEGEFEGVTRLVQENLFLALSFIFLLSRPNRFEDQPWQRRQEGKGSEKPWRKSVRESIPVLWTNRFNAVSNGIFPTLFPPGYFLFSLRHTTPSHSRNLFRLEDVCRRSENSKGKGLGNEKTGLDKR